MKHDELTMTSTTTTIQGNQWVRPLDAQGYTPAFYPRKSDLLKTWVGGGLNKSRRPGAAGLFRPSGRLLGARVTFSELCAWRLSKTRSSSWELNEDVNTKYEIDKTQVQVPTSKTSNSKVKIFKLLQMTKIELLRERLPGNHRPGREECNVNMDRLR